MKLLSLYSAHVFDKTSNEEELNDYLGKLTHLCFSRP